MVCYTGRPASFSPLGIMSSIYSLSKEDISDAVAWTTKNLSAVEALVDALPEDVLDVYPLLALLDPDRKQGRFARSWLKKVGNRIRIAAFVNEVHEVQSESDGKLTRDGKFGQNTARYLQERYAPSEGWIYDGIRRPLPALGDVQRVTYLDDPFWRLTKYNRRSKALTHGAVHWGSRSPRRLQNYFASTDRSVSSHGSVGYIEGTTDLLIAQTVDLALTTWHGTWMNHHSWGMDIAWTPVVDNADWVEAQGWPVEIIKNPTSRGHREIIALPEPLARATAIMLLEWSEVTGLPADFISTDWNTVMSREEILTKTGLIMHGQFDHGKWDANCYGEQIDAHLQELKKGR